MAEHKFFVEPLIASDAATRMLLAMKEVFPGQQAQSFHVSSSLGSFPLVRKPTPLADLPQVEPCSNTLEELRARPYLDVSHINLTLSPEFQITYREEPQQARAEIKISSSQPMYNQDQGKAFLPIVDAISKQFTILRHSETISRLFPENEQRLIALSQKVIGDFAAQAARLSQLNSQTVEDLHKAILEKAKELETDYATKRAHLDEEHNRRQREFADRESKFSERVKQFDLRDNTAVRRDLFNKLATAIDKLDTVTITDETKKKRRILHVLCASILVLSAGAFGVFANKIVNGNASADWRLFLPLGTALAMFATTAVFYIRWNNSWFYEHARAEFSNRKLKADMLRAGWLVEMFFEWDTKKQTAVPAELIGSCTRGLFVSDSLDGARHPIDDLQTLAKDFSKVRIGKTGFEFEKGSSEKKGA